MRYILLIMMLLMCGTANAEQRYNAMENRWETVPDNSNWSNRYNAMEGDWSYQPEGAEIEYNAMESSWDWDSGVNYNDCDM